MSLTKIERNHTNELIWDAETSLYQFDLNKKLHDLNDEHVGLFCSFYYSLTDQKLGHLYKALEKSIEFETKEANAIEKKDEQNYRAQKIRLQDHFDLKDVKLFNCYDRQWSIDHAAPFRVMGSTILGGDQRVSVSVECYMDKNLTETQLKDQLIETIDMCFSVFSADKDLVDYYATNQKNLTSKKDDINQFIQQYKWA